MSDKLKALLGIGALILAILVGVVFWFGRSSGGPGASLSDSALLTPPDSHQTGPASAQLTIVEFVDYQCPACGFVHPAVKRVLNEYQGEINFIVRHFPLAQHQNALIAAQAAEAAGEQGKFWEMHDALLENQKDWAESGKPLDIFVGYAGKLGLDLDQFKEAIESQKFAEKIAKDQQDVDRLGINAVPTFFFNGKRVNYEELSSYEKLKSRIESELTQ